MKNEPSRLYILYISKIIAAASSGSSDLFRIGVDESALCQDESGAGVVYLALL
jgi:hypothetical protein